MFNNTKRITRIMSYRYVCILGGLLNAAWKYVRPYCVDLAVYMEQSSNIMPNRTRIIKLRSEQK